DYFCEVWDSSLSGRVF
nr:immunoglobulin light chain junction region [Macaca mulatta]